MHSARRVVSALAMVVLAGGTAWSAGKITVDPNAAPKVKAPVPAPAPADTMLDQKVTYAKGQVRLHVVVDDLAQMTGVKILAGQSKNDWPVRDIPLVVCVKDMPLGKLLRAIADATHTSLSSEKTAEDPKKAYRIYRTTPAQRDIDTFFARRRESQLAMVKWQWDAMAACASSGTRPKDVDDRDWALARLVDAMGTQARDRVLAGDAFEPDAADSAIELPREELYRQWKVGVANGGIDTVDTLDLSKARESRLTAALRYGGDTGRTEIGISLRDKNGEIDYYLGCANLMRDHLKDLPPYPGDFANPHPKDDMGNPDMTFLRIGVDREMDKPLLKAKIDIIKPTDIKKPVFADLVRALAAASGLNIVTEDFISHQSADNNDGRIRFIGVTPPGYYSVDRLFVNNTDVITTLRELRVGKNYYWFMNEADKLLVGWNQGSREAGWRGEHRNLISEAYLNDLRAKIKGRGVESDDIVHLVSIPRESLTDWIGLDKDLNRLDQVHNCSEPDLWQLYDSLSAADKRLAKSEMGFPLSKIDRKWLAAFFGECRLLNTTSFRHDTASIPQRALADPAVVSTMMMYVENAKIDSAQETGTPRYMSNIRLVYELDGETQQASSNLGGMIFPVWTAEREAELTKASK